MNLITLTGAPGSGKTTLIHALQQEGFEVIHEVATQHIQDEQAAGIERPWEQRAFIESIAKKQREDLIAVSPDKTVFMDRGPICTLALARYLKHAVPKSLQEAIKLFQDKCDKVFLIDNLGKIEHTAVRQISFQESLVFEIMHLDAYREYGIEPMVIKKCPTKKRLNTIKNHLRPDV